jgi:hypothetical protein
MLKAHHDSTQDQVAIDEGYEIRDVQTGIMYKIAVALVALMVGSFLLMIAMFQLLYNPQEIRTADTPGTVLADQAEITGPQLQVSPRTEMTALRDQHGVSLSEYGVVNEDFGTARIPVDVALEQVAQRGLPIWEAAPESENTDPFAAAQSEMATGDEDSGLYEIRYRK